MRLYGSPSFTRIFARTNDSLTACGPTLVTISLASGICACAPQAKPSQINPVAADVSPRHFENFFSRGLTSAATSDGCVSSRFRGDIVVADFGCAFKPRDGLQKR